MDIKKQIYNYLLSHPIDRTKKSPYTEVAKQFGVDTEVVRCQWRILRNKGFAEEGRLIPVKNFVDKLSASDDSMTIEKTTNKRVKTLDDLIKVCDIDISVWEITSWECNKWEVGAVGENGKINIEPLFQVKAKLKRRTIADDLSLQKEVLMEEMKLYSPKVEKKEYDFKDSNCMLEISLFDLHLGKMANQAESGENYDIKIAERRVKKAVNELLKRVNLSLVKKIFLPIGNDLIHIDNMKATTFNDTPVETDTRFHKLVKTARRILIEIIDELSLIAPVDVVVVVGNHDTTVTWMLGEVLDAWYANNPNVQVNNAPKLRKYYKFGKNGFQLTHGDIEKHMDLGMIFATEQPKLWSDTEFRFCQLGHFHKQKKINYISMDSHQGFQIQILPSLSATDRWHANKGFLGLKQAKAFLYHPTEGQIAEYTYTI